METSETWNRGMETTKDETLREQDRSFADFVAEIGGGGGGVALLCLSREALLLHESITGGGRLLRYDRECCVESKRRRRPVIKSLCLSKCSAITAREAPTASANVGGLVAPFRHGLQRVMSPSSIPGTDTAEGIVHAPNRAPKFAFYYRTKRNARGCDLSR